MAHTELGHGPTTGSNGLQQDDDHDIIEGTVDLRLHHILLSLCAKLVKY